MQIPEREWFVRWILAGRPYRIRDPRFFASIPRRLFDEQSFVLLDLCTVRDPAGGPAQVDVGFSVRYVPVADNWEVWTWIVITEEEDGVELLERRLRDQYRWGHWTEDGPGGFNSTVGVGLADFYTSVQARPDGLLAPVIPTVAQAQEVLQKRGWA